MISSLFLFNQNIKKKKFSKKKCLTECTCKATYCHTSADAHNNFLSGLPQHLTHSWRNERTQDCVCCNTYQFKTQSNKAQKTKFLTVFSNCPSVYVLVPVEVLLSRQLRRRSSRTSGVIQGFPSASLFLSAVRKRSALFCCSFKQIHTLTHKQWNFTRPEGKEGSVLKQNDVISYRG